MSAPVGDPVNLLPDDGTCPMCGETLDELWLMGDRSPSYAICSTGCGAQYTPVMTVDGKMLQPVVPR